MQLFIRSMIACAALAALAVTATLADEEKIALDKLPKAVVAAVKEKFPEAEMKSAETEKKDGKTVYEVNIKVKGQTIEVTVTPEGKIVSIEKTIEVKDLPKVVSEAIEAKYPKSTIKSAEEVTEDGKVKFEAVIVTTDKKTLEVSFDPTGKFLEEEKKEEEKKEDKKDDKKKKDGK